MKRKVVKKKPSSAKRKKTKNANDYKGEMLDMRRKIDKSYKKLDQDLKKHAPYSTIEKDQNQLLMLLGECNYMVREFHLFQNKIK